MLLVGVDFVQSLVDQGTKLGATKALFAQTCQRPVLGQRTHRQLHGGKASKHNSYTGRILAPYRVKHVEAILVVIVSVPQRQVYHG